MAADKIRPAAIKAGIRLEPGQRFGFHNFRHSLATFLVSRGKDVKTIQELLRHAKVTTTLDLYSQALDAAKLAAQEEIAGAITRIPVAADLEPGLLTWSYKAFWGVLLFGVTSVLPANHYDSRYRETTQIVENWKSNFRPSYYVNVIYELSMGAFGPFRLGGFWWLFRASLEGLYVWPLLLITLTVVANLALALIHRWPFNRERWRRQYWLAFLTLLFVPITIAIGEIGWIDPSKSPRPKPSALLLWTNNGLLIASVVLGIFWVYRMKGLRWFAFALSLIQLWMLFWASSIASMAITGDWL